MGFVKREKGTEKGTEKGKTQKKDRMGTYELFFLGVIENEPTGFSGRLRYSIFLSSRQIIYLN